MADDMIKREDNQQGMDQKRDIPNEDLQQTNDAADGGHQGRTSFHSGSTTQGGSNYGQGSHHLGGEAYHQGDTSNTGTNYDNESGKFGQKGAGDVPHGQGAAGNEKESNAQEDYPGTLNDEGREDKDEHTKSMD